MTTSETNTPAERPRPNPGMMPKERRIHPSTPPVIAGSRPVSKTARSAQSPKPRKPSKPAGSNDQQSPEVLETRRQRLLELPIDEREALIAALEAEGKLAAAEIVFRGGEALGLGKQGRKRLCASLNTVARVRKQLKRDFQSESR